MSSRPTNCYYSSHDTTWGTKLSQKQTVPPYTNARTFAQFKHWQAGNWEYTDGETGGRTDGQRLERGGWQSGCWRYVCV